MPTEIQEGRRWPAPLGDRLPAEADAGQVADACVAIWLAIDKALNPIIGQGGVAALYSRSLKLAAAAHPWLPHSERGALAAIDTSALRAALVQQDAAQAAAGGSALVQSFHDLLVSLLGASLSERLLRSVWARSPGASPAQDTSS